jgi:hypothetical protein
VSGFVPLYQLAGQTFGVNWMLIASIHSQETSFSRDPTTYHGLNYAGCCGGPMQFNVTNGPVSTWSLVSDSYRNAPRPASYPHQTQSHPSIYDDFDAIMAAANLLHSNGATPDLGAGSWRAAYGYYGHDAAGVSYADQVLARAFMWSQQGFCPSCATDSALVSAVHAAYAPGGSGQLASFGSAATAPAPAPTADRGSAGHPAHHSSSRHSTHRPARRPVRGHHTGRRAPNHGHARSQPHHGSDSHPSGGQAFQPSSGSAGGAAAAAVRPQAEAGPQPSAP